MQRRALIQLAVSSCFISCTGASFAENKKILKISTMAGNDVLNQIASAILQHVYQQLPFQLSIISMPNERALQFANDGDVDGVLYRVRNINKTYPNLVIIPIPLMMIEFAVFSIRHSFVTNTWEDLAPYSIGFIRGIKIIEDNTKGMTREEAPTLYSAFKKMLVGRSDIVICEKNSGLSIIKELKLEKVRMLKTALPIFPVFHFLHKKHSVHIPAVTEALTLMTHDKTIDKIRTSVLEQRQLP